MNLRFVRYDSDLNSHLCIHVDNQTFSDKAFLGETIAMQILVLDMQPTNIESFSNSQNVGSVHDLPHQVFIIGRFSHNSENFRITERKL